MNHKIVSHYGVTFMRLKVPQGSHAIYNLGYSLQFI